jgi:hypothetical protein
MADEEKKKRQDYRNSNQHPKHPYKLFIVGGHWRPQQGWATWHYRVPTRVGELDPGPTLKFQA